MSDCSYAMYMYGLSIVGWDFLTKLAFCEDSVDYVNYSIRE